MKSRNIVIIVLVLAAFFVGGYFFLNQESVDTLEIQFISDHSISSAGDNAPSDIVSFADVYDSEDGTKLLSRLSFKRSDVGSNVDSITFSKTISSDLSSSEAEEMFDSEASNIIAKPLMYAKSTVENTSLDRDTNHVRHFYLTNETGKVDNQTYFGDAETLKKYIQEHLKNGDLFAKGDKPGTISILMLKGTQRNDMDSDPGNDVGATIENQPVEEESTDEVEVPQGPRVINARLNISGNNVSWNNELKSASRLVIQYVSNYDGKTLVSDDVTGQASHYFTYSNSQYEGSSIKVTLIATFDDATRVTNTSKSTSNLECH